MSQFNQITPAQAFRLIGTPEAPRIIDVRIGQDVAAQPRLIPASVRQPHTAIAPLTEAPGRSE